MKIETRKGPTGIPYDAYVMVQPDGFVLYVDVNQANASGNPEEFVIAEAEALAKAFRDCS